MKPKPYLTAPVCPRAGVMLRAALAGLCLLPPVLPAWANQPPVVVLTAPSSGVIFDAPASFNLEANASDADGGIARVEFWRGTSIKLGEVSAPPYRWTLTNVGKGTFTYTAKAVDSQGASAISSPITVTVNQLPTVKLNSPVAGTYTSERPIRLAATATDDGGIAKVEFFADGVLIGALASPPYEMEWSGVVAGPHAVNVRATDNLNGARSSAAVVVTVNPANTAPTVTLTAPGNNSVLHLPGSVTLKATASDLEKNDGIKQVEFRVGSTLLHVATTSPYKHVWVPEPGVHSLMAKAIDHTGAATVSTARTFTANVRPTVTLSSPPVAGGHTAPADISLAAAAVDVDGTIAKVDFYAGDVLLKSVTKAPFVHTLTGAQAGSYTFTAKAYDNRNAATLSNPIGIEVMDALSPVIYSYDELGRLIGVNR